MARRGTERVICGGSTVFCWMVESPAVLALTGERNVEKTPLMYTL